MTISCYFLFSTCKTIISLMKTPQFESFIHSFQLFQVTKFYGRVLGYRQIWIASGNAVLSPLTRHSLSSSHSGKANVQNQSAPSTAVSLCYRSLLKCSRTSACHALKHSCSGNDASIKVVSLPVARCWIASSLYAYSLNAGLNTESPYSLHILI